jgi:hypothetical protein
MNNKPIQHSLQTQMEAAFSKFLGKTLHSRPLPKRQWNASLSYPTYQALKRQGIMN